MTFRDSGEGAKLIYNYSKLELFEDQSDPILKGNKTIFSILPLKIFRDQFPRVGGVSVGIHYGFACYFAITLSNAVHSLIE